VKGALFALVGLAVAAAAVFGAFRLGLVHLSAPRVDPAASHAARARPAEPPVSVPIPSITTNLGDTGGTHFAQVTVTVSVAGPLMAKRVDSEMPAVENAVIADLRQMTSAELDASNGMTVLRGAITTSLDGVLGPGAVRAVYFTQFIVQ